VSATATESKPEVMTRINGTAPQKGDDVIWYETGEPNAGNEFYGKIVDLGYGTSIEIGTLQPNSEYVRVRPGVKHVSDPTLRPDEKAELGAWDWTPRQKQVIDLIAQLSDAAAASTKKPATPGK
jgi:hypothetical protein